MNSLLFLATLLAALGSGLIAGTFFAFSSFVMPALARLPAAQGMAAMQSINLVVLNPLFLGVFLGTALLALGLGGTAFAQWTAPGSGWLLAGAALYLLGTFGVTAGFHVPRNEALATLAPTDPAAAEAWTRYLREWIVGNHVRTLAALGAAACFTLALLRR